MSATTRTWPIPRMQCTATHRSPDLSRRCEREMGHAGLHFYRVGVDDPVPLGISGTTAQWTGGTRAQEFPDSEASFPLYEIPR